jgi:CO/xanthine dehydrogenase FAD-binding subunit
LATILLALDAEVELAGRDETGWSSLNDFYLSRDNPKAPSTKAVLVIRIRFDVDPRRKIVFHKMARRLLNSGAVVTVALSLRFDAAIVREARVALGGVGPRPIRALSTERILTGSSLDLEVIESAAQAALEDCNPQTDAYASAWYRRRMVLDQLQHIVAAGLPCPTSVRNWLGAAAGPDGSRCNPMMSAAFSTNSGSLVAKELQA